jgi:hypothetical protein
MLELSIHLTELLGSIAIAFSATSSAFAYLFILYSSLNKTTIANAEKTMTAQRSDLEKERTFSRNETEKYIEYLKNTSLKASEAIAVNNHILTEVKQILTDLKYAKNKP